MCGRTFGFGLTGLTILVCQICSGNVGVSQILNNDRLPENAAELEARFITNSRNLTSAGQRAGEGYFSADGRYMVFQSERVEGNPFFQIYRMDLNSGRTIQISPGYGKTTCAWIHPVSGDILFASTHADPDALDKQREEISLRQTSTTRRYAWPYDEYYDLYRWDAKTKELTRLTDAFGYDAEGSYSPCGEWICFASNREAYVADLPAELVAKRDTSPEYFMNLYIMRSDGTELRKLTDRKGYDGGPFFSADGKRICWRSFDENGIIAEIWTMNVDGSDKKQLTRLGTTAWAPYFHPSGKYLIFTTNLHGYSNFELYIVDDEGKSPPRRVTYTDGFDGLPVFSPDGKQIAWSSERNSSRGQIMNSERKHGAQIEIADWNHAAALNALGIDETETINDAHAGSESADKPISDLDKPSEVVVQNQETATGLELQPYELAAMDDGRAAASKTDPEFLPVDFQQHVYYLCQPALKGRMSGTPGERQAVAYVAGYFEALGLQPAGDQDSWFQIFEFPAGAALGDNCRLQVNETELTIDVDWRPLSFSQAGSFEASDVVFAGYGIAAEKDGNQDAYDSFVHLDVKDKWVIVLRHMPEDVDDERRQFLAIYSNLSRKAMEIRDRGARGMLVVNGPRSQFKEKLIPLANDFIRGKTSLGAVSISNEIAEQWLQRAGHNLNEIQTKLDAGEPIMGFAIPGLKINVEIDIRQSRGTGRNVIGRLQWGDEPSSEVVVIGAHIDHLGEGRSSSSRATSEDTSLIHYGADDNASGVAGLLEIAEHFANMKNSGDTEELNRDIIFAAWSAEELGLHGSNHYVKTLQLSLLRNSHGELAEDLTTESLDELGPNVPLPRLNQYVAAYLNMDMIGRYRGRLQLQGLGSSSDWDTLIEASNFKLQLDIAKILDTNLPTDATGFYRGGTPIASAFSGSHLEYHTPRDTPDRLNYPDAARIANLMGNLALNLSELNSGPEFKRYDKVEEQSRSARMGVVYLGTHPDYAYEETGVRITGTTAGSPAEKAGLKEGDVILSLAGRQVENLSEYMATMGGLKVGRETEVRIRRNGEELTLKITPGVRE
ncbi:MAG TPA: M28 family peptidase [Pirellulaceae bacterium]|nr:M28 family peptidase [Pirellulaceae bacterium]HMO93289.1 M28 family peptidase [Pirellulaceae bacterium]HMP70171.1 M28 family peptidase [Pirellulaceae bacterium]